MELEGACDNAVRLYAGAPNCSTASGFNSRSPPQISTPAPYIPLCYGTPDTQRVHSEGAASLEIAVTVLADVASILLRCRQPPFVS